MIEWGKHEATGNEVVQTDLDWYEGAALARRFALDTGDAAFEIMAGQIERGEAKACLRNGEFVVTLRAKLTKVLPIRLVRGF